MRQHGLTVITPIKVGMETKLRDLLNSIGNDIDENGKIKFYGFCSVHFMRWVVLEAAQVRGKAIPPQLILSTNYDGKQKAHLHELIKVGGEGLKEIYSHCEGFRVEMDEEDFYTYLKKHRKKNAAFYVGKTGRTVKQVQQEYELREAMQDALEQNRPANGWKSVPVQKIREKIQQGIAQKPEFTWTQEPYKDPFLQLRGTLVLMLSLFLLLLAAGAAFVFAFLKAPLVAWIGLAIPLVFALTWWIFLKINEKKDRKNFVSLPKDIQHIEQLKQREDYRVQNQLTHLVDIKPGLFRIFTLKVILWAINLLARAVFNKGNLGGIHSIHFARWVIIDGGRRLIFFSNFDGSWESYLGDFIDRGSIGLSGVWSNSVDFPPTRNLVQEGARYSRDFKAWTRSKQVETQVWFSHYKTITVKNGNQNTALRQGLAGDLDETAIKNWLKLM